jgi:hypothetical protein
MHRERRSAGLAKEGATGLVQRGPVQSALSCYSRSRLAFSSVLPLQGNYIERKIEWEKVVPADCTQATVRAEYSYMEIMVITREAAF